MNPLVEAYNELISNGKEPKRVMCHSSIVHFVIKDLYHGHIPITEILIIDTVTRGRFGFSWADELDIIPEMKEYYQEYKVILPPSVAEWKKRGFTEKEIEEQYAKVGAVSQ